MSNADYRVFVLKEANDLLKGVANRLARLKGISPAIIATLDELLRIIASDLAKDQKPPKGPKPASRPSDRP